MNAHEDACAPRVLVQVKVLERLRGHLLQSVVRPLSEPVDGAAVDQRREHS